MILEIPPGIRRVDTEDIGADAIAKAVRSLSRALAETGQDVVLFDLASPKIRRDFPQNKRLAIIGVKNPLSRLITAGRSSGAGGSQTRTINAPTSEGLATGLFSVKALPKVLRLSKGGAILHIYNPYQVVFFNAVRRILRGSYRIVYTTANHSVLMASAFKRDSRGLIIESLAVRQADLIVCLTSSSAYRLTTLFGLSRDKIRVIPFGVEIPPVPDSDTQSSVPGVPRILNVARIQPRKNQIALAKALVKLQDYGIKVQLELVGPIEDSIYFRNLMTYIEGSGLSVEFHGEVSESSLDKIYNRSTVFAFPSLQETQGLVILEAMAHGLPVIASKIPPFVDLLGLEQTSALLVDFKDESSSAFAIACLLLDSQKMKNLSRNGKLKAREFGWLNIAKTYSSAFQSLTAFD